MYGCASGQILELRYRYILAHPTIPPSHQAQSIPTNHTQGVRVCVAHRLLQMFTSTCSSRTCTQHLQETDGAIPRPATEGFRPRHVVGQFPSSHLKDPSWLSSSLCLMSRRSSYLQTFIGPRAVDRGYHPTWLPLRGGEKKKFWRSFTSYSSVVGRYTVPGPKIFSFLLIFFLVISSLQKALVPWRY